MTAQPIRVDIVSDVVCPWCIVGFRQLEAAATETGIAIETYWHPFELNFDMVPEGENLRDHIKRKYGSNDEQSRAARQSLADIGAGLGIDFQFADDSRIYNTFDAHRLLHWAAQSGMAHALKMALFDAYFSRRENPSDHAALAEIAARAGLDSSAATQVLTSGQYSEEVREKEQFWINQGVRGVPAMVFQSKHLVTGAQGAENYARILEHLWEETEKAEASAPA